MSDIGSVLPAASAGLLGTASPPVASNEWPLSAADRCFKRAIDLCLAPLALLILLPVLLVAVVAIRLDSPGPAIFKQVRLGRGGRRFCLYKLRTMVVDNDDSAHRAYLAAMIEGRACRNDGLFKLTDDPRITRVGRILRRLSVDELPQLWNVLRGDMSLIGPRPPLPTEAALYEAWMWQRLSGKPGVTGLWQVSGRCQLSFDEMVRLDIDYWRRWTPLLDLKILLRSIPAVLTGKGAA